MGDGVGVGSLGFLGVPVGDGDGLIVGSGPGVIVGSGPGIGIVGCGDGGVPVGSGDAVGIIVGSIVGIIVGVTVGKAAISDVSPCDAVNARTPLTRKSAVIVESTIFFPILTSSFY